jgi:hypothetical protein
MATYLFITIIFQKRATVMEHIWSWPFLWQGDMGLILALIKIVEDRLNIEDIYKGHVRAILLVEDNVQFYSAYLYDVFCFLFYH